MRSSLHESQPCMPRKKILNGFKTEKLHPDREGAGLPGTPSRTALRWSTSSMPSTLRMVCVGMMPDVAPAVAPAPTRCSAR